MVTSTIPRTAGSFDHARPVEQMQAIDLVLRHYFQTPLWLAAKNSRCRR